MGYPMARNLLRAGHSVPCGSNTRPRRGAWPKKNGPNSVHAPAGAEAAGIVFLCVGDTAMSERVTLGPDGILDGVRAGSIVADCSTVAPSYARRAAAGVGREGRSLPGHARDGLKTGRRSGTLTFMIGGEPVNL